MKLENFKQYKTQYRAAIRNVLANAKPGMLDEAAFPAYSHPNPVINWIFWQRLGKVMNYLKRAAPYQMILDFGCGSGVMEPFLASISQKVIAVDIDLGPIQMMQNHITFPQNIEFHDIKQRQLHSFPKNSFDIIVALDVLEHVEDLPYTLSNLCQLLKPGGQLIVSVPTENMLYRIGRKIAGPEYSGEYHKRDAREIRYELSKITKVRHIAAIYPPLPLFELFTGVA